MFVAKSTRRVGNRVYNFYSLRKAVWDKQTKRQRQVYVAGLGPSRTISMAKAQAICAKLGIPLDDLRRVKGLRIKLEELREEQKSTNSS